ncbi:hypothetical protein [Helicobacter trogontum]|uniref:Uncharacterized protein n=1 Tax=Helicobacter trogontum TaxID=50960 RepID=A0A4U8S335_9HELI|nr:hypothetical protein [Helicobacter trogontum]TLD80057.1 hypothetical protein LS81_009745 [Helicobacter trogontum]
MEKIFFKILYHSIATSLCLGIILVLIRISFEWLGYSMIYDLLAMYCGFISAIILVSYNIFQGIMYHKSIIYDVFYFKSPFDSHNNCSMCFDNANCKFIYAGQNKGVFYRF